MDKLLAELKAKAPRLFNEVSEIAEPWSKVVCENLRRLGPTTRYPKTITDPVWGPIDLFEWEVAFLDSPMLQRLRGIRQLGMAHLVYPGAVHDRFSHSLGVLAVVTRMMDALEKNVLYRSEYGSHPDPETPKPIADDRFALRLAALLHDTGHCAFSHASETLIEERYKGDLATVSNLLRANFEGAGNIQPSEAIAALILLSDPMGRVFANERLRIPYKKRGELRFAVVARILGSRRFLEASYLAQTLSGPIDADKIDYMVRDSYYAGLPLSLDADRLIDKVEIITITPDNVNDPHLRERAEKAPNKKLYQVGLSYSGLTAYEQLVVGRVLLYDRIYYHHKVRCAEAMTRRFLVQMEKCSSTPLKLQDLLSPYSDDTLIHAFGVKIDEKTPAATRFLHQALKDRLLLHRAFAFAERFMAGYEVLGPKEANDTKANLWQDIYEQCLDTKIVTEIEEQISEQVATLIPLVGSEYDSSVPFDPSCVILDFAEDRVTSTGKPPLLRTEEGTLIPANLFFEPEKWSNAYRSRKQCGYIFSQREHALLVSCAAQMVFFSRFGLILKDEAFMLCKLDGDRRSKFEKWSALAAVAGVCSKEFALAYAEKQPRLLSIKPDDIKLPEEWTREDTQVRKRLSEEFASVLPGGMVASVKTAVLDGLEHIANVISSLDKSAVFKEDSRPDETTKFQAELVKLLRARNCALEEGTKVAGGESDIILSGGIVVENKVVGVTAAPKSEQPKAGWQTRRYAIAYNSRVSFLIIGYKPASESAYFSQPDRIFVERLSGCPEARALIKVLIPWGFSSPSRAQVPP